MRYVYTAEGCPACINKKEEYRKDGIPFVERSSNRLKVPADDKDDLDVEAFAVLCEQQMNLPVVVSDGKE